MTITMLLYSTVHDLILYTCSVLSINYSVRSRTDTMQSSALNYLSKLEEALLTLGEFEDAYIELMNWLNKINEELSNGDPLIGHTDSLAIQFDSIKVYS